MWGEKEVISREKTINTVCILLIIKKYISQALSPAVKVSYSHSYLHVPSLHHTMLDPYKNTISAEANIGLQACLLPSPGSAE